MQFVVQYTRTLYRYTLLCVGSTFTDVLIYYKANVRQAILLIAKIELNSSQPDVTPVLFPPPVLDPVSVPVPVQDPIPGPAPVQVPVPVPVPILSKRG